MIKKKSFDFKNPLVWGSAIVSLGIVFTFMTKIVDFFRIPDALAQTNQKVEKLENTTQQIAEVLKEQQVINKYIHEQEVKNKEKILSPDGKRYWSDEDKAWRKL